jgi:hypothetical protein
MDTCMARMAITTDCGAASIAVAAVRWMTAR